MTKDSRDVNPDLVKQEIEKGRMGDRELAKKPGEKPPPKDGTESDGVNWDDDQQALIDNQNKSENEHQRRKDGK